MAHYHMLLWAEGAPNSDDPAVTQEEVAAFIDAYVTNEYPNADVAGAPRLRHLVDKYQVNFLFYQL